MGLFKDLDVDSSSEYEYEEQLQLPEEFAEDKSQQLHADASALLATHKRTLSQLDGPVLHLEKRQRICSMKGGHQTRQPLSKSIEIELDYSDSKGRGCELWDASDEIPVAFNNGGSEA
ncbi:hypothetical protein VNI00_019135 [Paramarasmius palmivorus]|uniref:Uncharacterized protein n=1 Tax=Paramarasmius palmivorus TaxID=297713 RepID=A0AAW0AQC2_9AGAR